MESVSTLPQSASVDGDLAIVSKAGWILDREVGKQRIRNANRDAFLTAGCIYHINNVVARQHARKHIAGLSGAIVEVVGKRAHVAGCRY